MPQHRVQFQPDPSMVEFMSLYGKREKCEAALMLRRWPQGIVCPRCGGKGARRSFKRGNHTYWQCAKCPRQSTVLAGTIFEHTRLPRNSWFLAMHLLTLARSNVSALELKRHLGISYPSAWLLKQTLMEVMRRKEADRRLSWRVELDDAYLGTQRSGGKAGRGSENKDPFIIAVETKEDRKPHLVCLSRQPFTKQAMDGFVGRSLSLPLALYSDGLGCFSAVQGAGIVHHRFVTGGRKKSTEVAELNTCNVVPSNLKTAIAGTYHAFKFGK
jgi:transposase-like protein